MMLGEQSESADYWKQCGDEALANGIKGVVMMGAHWDATGDAIEVAMNPSPGKSPVAYVHPSKYPNAIVEFPRQAHRFERLVLACRAQYADRIDMVCATQLATRDLSHHT